MRRAHRGGVMLLGFLACPKREFSLLIPFITHAYLDAIYR